LTPSEQAMYRRLTAALPNHIILAEVAFSQFLRHNDYAKFGTMRQKVADFLVCNSEFKIVSIIELDDPSHDRKHAADAERDANSASAGLRTVRWHVSRMPEGDEIRSRVLGLP
jgi:very-short-patch-repair endonuclease